VEAAAATASAEYEKRISDLEEQLAAALAATAAKPEEPSSS
jgi:hypothetical protein